MEKYSKLIDQVLKKLDWTYIMKYYDSYREIDENIQVKGKKININSKSIQTVKKELKELIKFVVDGNFNEIQHDNWMIFWSIKKSGCRLEIIFTPTRVVISEDENIVKDDTIGSDDVERDVLQEMLDKAVKEENYELAEACFSRIKKLDKILGDKDKKKDKDI